MDATTLGDRWTVLSISVLVHQNAIPVAWRVLWSNQQGAWQPVWETLERLTKA